MIFIYRVFYMQLHRLLIILVSFTISAHALSLKHIPSSVQPKNSKQDLIKKVAMWTGVALGSVLVIAGSVFGYKYSKYSTKKHAEVELDKIFNAKSLSAADIDDDIRNLKQNHPKYQSYLESQEAQALVDGTKKRIRTNYQTVVRLSNQLGQEYDLGKIKITDEGVDVRLNDSKVTLLMKVLYNIDTISQPLFEQIFQALLDANADPNAKDRIRSTPFDYLKFKVLSILKDETIRINDKLELFNRAEHCIQLLQA